MKTLILVRHAKTEQLSFSSAKSDFERELKPRGHKDSEMIARNLKRRHNPPDLIISSNAERAKQTAVNFAGLLGIDTRDILLEPFLYGGYTSAELADYLSQYNHDYDSIMIIGHNPEIESAAISLTGNTDLQFPTVGTIAISFNVDSWQEIETQRGNIEWFITPKMLK
ncbi:SixA phosphatase family protein [Vibrio sp.]|uniref:SixA phosphatase family protein n=1 Tax=Vibrio sp. TaxID=678 RepID=UPI003D0A4B42